MKLLEQAGTVGQYISSSQQSPCHPDTPAPWDEKKKHKLRGIQHDSHDKNICGHEPSPPVKRRSKLPIPLPLTLPQPCLPLAEECSFYRERMRREAYAIPHRPDQSVVFGSPLHNSAPEMDLLTTVLNNLPRPLKRYPPAQLSSLTESPRSKPSSSLPDTFAAKYIRTTTDGMTTLFQV